ncbi:MAG: AAA family ATPase [Candidatus Thiodiazotropha sp.]
MLHTLAISNYRSILDLVVPLGPLNVITGSNGSGKSNLYRALRLLAETSTGGVVSALAREGGLQSTFWAGPATISDGMRSGKVSIEGTHQKGPKRLRLGFAGDDFGYAISLGLPKPPDRDDPEPTAFSLDPEIKRETIWSGLSYRPSGALIDRIGPITKTRESRKWEVIAQHIPNYESMFTHTGDPERTPEIVRLREEIRAWRFYDHLRTDSEAPARQPQLGTRSPVLDHDGHTLAATWQTIREIGDREVLNEVVSDAFPGAHVTINTAEDNRFSLTFHQEGLLRGLNCTELSDGTLRYLLWIAALMTPRPPPLMVLNEPETSLHPDLLPALGRLIIKASEYSQILVVTHAPRLVNTLAKDNDCNEIQLEKTLGQTEVLGQGMLDKPSWQWPE